MVGESRKGTSLNEQGRIGKYFNVGWPTHPNMTWSDQFSKILSMLKVDPR